MPPPHDDTTTPDAPPATPDATPDSPDTLARLSEQLAASRQTIATLERRARIETLLREAQPVDLEAARLLTEAAVSQMDQEDLASAVADLRRHKPYLFKQAPGTRGSTPGAMAPRPDTTGVVADEAAAHATATGDRRDLLAYLRMKRGR